LAFGALSGGDEGHIGGVERQTSLLAFWLAGRGHEVSVLTWDEGQGDEVMIAGVRVIGMGSRRDGLPGLRFFHPRWTRLNAALRRADAELYYQNCAEYVTGQVAAWCRRHRRRFVYSLANSADCDPRLPEMQALRERLFYRYGLRRADGVIAQTEQQRRQLACGFNREAVCLPMPCPGPARAEYSPPRHGVQPFRVGWVARIAPVKRLEVLLDTARELPDIHFEVAGAPNDMQGYARKLLARARAMNNVTLRGQLARREMPAFYRGVSALCCTSSFEGFPNTFLEAWSHGLPVVSTVDPDDLLSANGMGIAARGPSDLVPAIRTLAEDAQTWRSMSANARAHYLDHHALDPAMSRFEKLFLRVLGGGAGS
jgi:glycosyltransferase involved in cell wall biosynthesis